MSASETLRSTRIGGDLVTETLEALGATSVVGIPGQHALGLFDALRRSSLHFLSARVENNAGFMADGIARTTGLPAPLFLSTGPGALTALPALQESAAASIPIVAISAQIPVAGLGGGRHGYLHELPDQSRSFTGVVKHVRTVRKASQIPSAVVEAWEIARSVPQGPVLLEIPQDVLLEHLPLAFPRVTIANDPPRGLYPRAELVSAAAQMLGEAANPRIFAGGGVIRANAQDELVQLAEALGAPVISTFSGKGAIPLIHPLAAGSWIEDIATTEFLESADVLLIVGTGVGELSSNYGTFTPRGRVIHIEADLGKLNANHPGLGIHADARLTLAALLAQIGSRATEPALQSNAVATANLRRTIDERLSSQGLERERQLLQDVRDATPPDVDTFWDMTILGYWAWSEWDTKDGLFASGHGAGGLGYAFPAAIGAAFARQTDGRPRATLAVAGDGGAMYGIAELATVAQHNLNVTWLIIDDGGYGVLAEYMRDEFGAATATDLHTPNFVQLAHAFGVPAIEASADEAGDVLANALATPGPSVVLIRTRLSLFHATHLDR